MAVLKCGLLLSPILADVNECSNVSLNECDMNASCMDTIGSYVCTCNDGYLGDGFNCSGEITCDCYIIPDYMFTISMPCRC